MADSRVASRYVRSLLGLAVDQNALEPVHQDMLMFDLKNEKELYEWYGVRGMADLGGNNECHSPAWLEHRCCGDEEGSPRR